MAARCGGRPVGPLTWRRGAGTTLMYARYVRSTCGGRTGLRRRDPGRACVAVSRAMRLPPDSAARRAGWAAWGAIGRAGTVPHRQVRIARPRYQAAPRGTRPGTGVSARRPCGQQRDAPPRRTDMRRRGGPGVNPRRRTPVGRVGSAARVSRGAHPLASAPAANAARPRIWLHRSDDRTDPARRARAPQHRRGSGRDRASADSAGQDRRSAPLVGDRAAVMRAARQDRAKGREERSGPYPIGPGWRVGHDRRRWTFRQAARVPFSTTMARGHLRWSPRCDRQAGRSAHPCDSGPRRPDFVPFGPGRAKPRAAGRFPRPGDGAAQPSGT